MSESAVAYRRASLDDAAGIARLMSDPEVLPGTLQLPMPSAELWRRRLERQLDDTLSIHIVAVSDGELIGSAGLHPVTQSLRTRHSAGLGICVAKTWWSRGIGSGLMQRLLDWADNWAGLLRIELGVFSDNARAIALYRRFGFEPEGTQRASALRCGQYVDTLMMARLHPHPPQLPPR